MKPTPRTEGLRSLVVAAPWLCCAIAALFWFNSAQASIEHQMENTAWPESPATKLTRENLRSFNRQAPQRTLIASIVPFDPKRANSWLLYMDPTWKQQSPTEQRRLMRTWTALYSHIAKTNPVDASPPQLIIRATQSAPFKQ